MGRLAVLSVLRQMGFNIVLFFLSDNMVLQISKIQFN